MARAPPAPAPAKAVTPAKRKAPSADETAAETSPAASASAAASSSAFMFRRVERGVEYDVVVSEDGGYKRRRVGSVGKARQWHYFCLHGTRKERCKECGGSSICEYNGSPTQPYQLLVDGLTVDKVAVEKVAGRPPSDCATHSALAPHSSHRVAQAKSMGISATFARRVRRPEPEERQFASTARRRYPYI